MENMASNRLRLLSEEEVLGENHADRIYDAVQTLDTKMDALMLDVGVLKNNQSHQAEGLKEITDADKLLEERVRAVENKQSWILGAACTIPLVIQLALHFLGD